jgi:succinyl-diaminopimelate desuccinylase
VSPLVDDLVWLMGIRSVTGEEEALCTAIARRLSPRWGADGLTRIGNALVVGRPDDRPLLSLYGHLDTVPEQGNVVPEIREGRVHGLGAADMKGGVAVMLALLEDDEVAGGPYSVAGVFYDKEEGPAHRNGLEDVLHAVPWLGRSRFAVVLEPSDRQIQLGCQGAMNATVSFLGRSAHSARPWLGENAVTKAGEFLAEIHRMEPVPVSVEGLEFKETATITTAHGGLASNVIPPRFDLNLNYRFPPTLTLEEAEARLRAIAAAADEVTVVDRAPAAPIPAGNPHLQRLERVSGAPRAGKQAWTDVARLAARGIAAVNFGPGETALAHRPDESVAIDDLEGAHAGLRRFLLEA